VPAQRATLPPPPVGSPLPVAPIPLPGAGGMSYRLGRVGGALTIGAVLLASIAAAAIVAVARNDTDATRILGAINLVVCGLILLVGVIALVVVAAITASSTNQRTRFRALSIGGAVVFALPSLLVLLFALIEVVASWRGALFSVPTTVLALWTFRRMQRNRKPPWLLVLLAFLWGAAVSSYYASMVEGTIHVVIAREVLPGVAAVIGHAAAAAFPEELAKGAGVVVLVLLARRRVDGMLSGIVVGASIGLGFQFAESLSYMMQDLDTILYQHWYRQVSGLFVGHATYTGIIGAGVGLATQQAGRWRKAVCGASGFLVAIAAHLVWDICAMGRYYWESDDAVVQLFVIQPLNLLVLKGPGFVLLLVLVVLGMRLETTALHRHLHAEMANRLNAVTPAEAALLIDSPRRFRTRMRVWWLEGWAPYKRLSQLHATQLDLAFARWHRERGFDQPQWAEETLRQKIYRLKAEATQPAPPAGAPAARLSGPATRPEPPPSP